MQNDRLGEKEEEIEVQNQDAMKNIDNKIEYICYLKAHVARYLSILETIFGPRDPRFVFHTIKHSEDGPYTNFPQNYYLNGGCLVEIFISSRPWERRSLGQGPWQIAHECVHLLDPGLLNSSNILEEGLATWFQNEPKFHDEQVKSFISMCNISPNYLEAQDLVRSNLPNILYAVKLIRASGVRIRDIKADRLETLLSGVAPGTIERLCAPFEN